MCTRCTAGKRLHPECKQQLYQWHCAEACHSLQDLAYLGHPQHYLPTDNVKNVVFTVLWPADVTEQAGLEPLNKCLAV